MPVFFFVQKIMFISIKNKKYIEEKKLNQLSYQYTDEERKEIANIVRDFDYAYNIKNKGYREFDDLNVIDRESIDQKAFNTYIPPKNTSDEDGWKAQTKRPTTRNKVITIGAKITSNIIAPQVFAQNDEDEEDRDAGKVMGLAMRWVIDNSNYEKTFFNAVIAMLVNPVAYVYVDYNKKHKFYNIPVSEIYIANNYIYDIQDQPFIIRNRNIDLIISFIYNCF